MEDPAIAETRTIEKAANWKLPIEGGIGAYHFKVAHKDTIGPHFMDNLSSYKKLGAYMRPVLPRTSLPDLTEIPREDWAIRDHANVLYSVFPLDRFLAMRDYIAWISTHPLAHDRTELRLTALVPKDEVTPKKAAHWAHNQKITEATLVEDFEINGQVQARIATGANEALTFGRYEGTLHAFDVEVESRL